MKRRSIELLLFVGFTAGLCQAALEPAKADAPASGFFQVDLSRHANRKLTEPLLSPGNNLAELAEGLNKDNPVKTLKAVPFRKVWDNPHPDREIKSLDMVTGDQESGQAAPAPFLVALTGAAPPAQ